MKCTSINAAECCLCHTATYVQNVGTSLKTQDSHICAMSSPSKKRYHRPCKKAQKYMFLLRSSDFSDLSSDFGFSCWGQVTPAICQVTRSNMSCFRWCQAISATCQVTLAFLVGIKWLQLRVKWLGQISHVFVGVKRFQLPVKWLELEIVQLSRASRDSGSFRSCKWI